VTGLHPGTVIGDQRYVTVRALSTQGEAEVWSAQDNETDQLVTLVVMPLSAPTTAAVLDAASRSAGVDNPRLVRVLDVGSEFDHGFFVEESLDGAQSLTSLAGGIGMAAEEVRRLTGEVALALDAASRRGLHHLGLTPDNVLRMPDGSVKLTGLATQAALAGQDHVGGKRALRRDAKGLVALAYAGLTGRWPLGGDVGLPPAPKVVGGVPRPSEIAVGIPADLDTIAHLTLNQNLGPVSPGDYAAQIAPWPSLSVAERDVLAIPGTGREDDSLEIPLLGSHASTPGLAGAAAVGGAGIGGAAVGAARAAGSGEDTSTDPGAEAATGAAAATGRQAAREADSANAGAAPGSDTSAANDVTAPIETGPRGPMSWLGRGRGSDDKAAIAGPVTSPVTPDPGTSNSDTTKPGTTTPRSDGIPGKKAAAAGTAAVGTAAAGAAAAGTAAAGSAAAGSTTTAAGAAGAGAAASAAISGALDSAGAFGKKLAARTRSGLGGLSERTRNAIGRSEGATSDHRELKAAIRREEAASEVSIDQAPQQPELEAPAPLLPAEAGAQPSRAQSRFVLATFAAALAVIGIVAGAVAFRPPKSNLEAILGPDTIHPTSASSTSSQTTTEPPAGTAEAVPIVGATGYDPEGDGAENNDQAARVFDEDPSTFWQSEGYQGPKFGGLKSGVGLVVDLGQDVTPSSITLTLPNPSSLELYLGSEPDRTGANLIGTVTNQQGEVSVPVTDSATGRYVIVWFTDAPQVADGRWRAMLSEIAVLG